MTHTQSVDYKEKIKKCFDKQVQPMDFKEEDLIPRWANGPKKEANKGKMATNWERLYKIVESLKNEAY